MVREESCASVERVGGGSRPKGVRLLGRGRDGGGSARKGPGRGPDGSGGTRNEGGRGPGPKA